MDKDLENKIEGIKMWWKLFFDSWMWKKNNPLFIFVNMTNIAFWCELIIKALLRKNNIEIKWKGKEKHNIKKLFEQLPLEIQLKTKEQYNKEIESTKLIITKQEKMIKLHDPSYQGRERNYDFNFLIDKCSESFIRIRYLYEKEISKDMDLVESCIPFFTLFWQILYKMIDISEEKLI